METKIFFCEFIFLYWSNKIFKDYSKYDGIDTMELNCVSFLLAPTFEHKMFMAKFVGIL